MRSISPQLKSRCPCCPRHSHSALGVASWENAAETKLQCRASQLMGGGELHCEESHRLSRTANTCRSSAGHCFWDRTSKDDPDLTSASKVAPSPWVRNLRITSSQTLKAHHPPASLIFLKAFLISVLTWTNATFLQLPNFLAPVLPQCSHAHFRGGILFLRTQCPVFPFDWKPLYCQCSFSSLPTKLPLTPEYSA